MDYRKVSQWLTVQQKKGGPALAILEQWVKELQPAPKRNSYENSGWSIEWFSAETVYADDALLEPTTYEPIDKQNPKDSHRALNKHERRWRKK